MYMKYNLNSAFSNLLNIREIRKVIIRAASDLTKQNFIPYHILPYL